MPPVRCSGPSSSSLVTRGRHRLRSDPCPGHSTRVLARAEPEVSPVIRPCTAHDRVELCSHPRRSMRYGRMRARAPSRWTSVPMAWWLSSLKNRCMVEHVRPTTQSHADGARQLDRESRAWLESLRSDGARYDAAISRLHALLLSEARYQVRRRTAALAHPSGRDLDDLAMQAADDALVAILGKLDRFRGDALFSTWARRFAELEVPGKIRRRLGHARETPTETETLELHPARDEDALGNQRGGRHRGPARRADRPRPDGPPARGSGRAGHRRGRLQGSRDTSRTRLPGLSTRRSTTRVES